MSQKEYEDALSEIEGWGPVPGNYLNVKAIRAYVTSLEQELGTSEANYLLLKEENTILKQRCEDAESQMKSKFCDFAKAHADERCPGMDETDIVWSMCFDDYLQGACMLLSEIDKWLEQDKPLFCGEYEKAGDLYRHIKALFKAKEEPRE